MKTNVLLLIETQLAKELVDTIDQRIEEIIKKCNTVDDPDSLGYFDSAEHVTGLGFVVLQSYITAVYGNIGISKKIALLTGPKHEGGYTIVKIVNDAANYWKHNNEWRYDKNDKRRELIESTFEDIGFPVGIEYPLSGILTELSVPNFASFNAIFEKLQEWSNELQNTA